MDITSYNLEVGTLTPEEFIHLSKAVGWGVERQYDMVKVGQALKDSSLLLRIKDQNGRTVACGRAFSDDLLMTFIPDIFVHPDHQKRGLGKMLIEAIKDRFGHTVFYFGAQPGKEQFYEGLGFKKGMQSYTGTFKKNPYFD